MKSCPNCHNTYPSEFNVCPQDGTALVERGTWARGALVRGKYRILDKIGQGGMGSVYKAQHVAFDELRALKVMHPSLMSDELFVKRFRHEAVITRRLQHPNAVRVDDIDETEDHRPFIVMEYIEGKSLKKLIHDEGALAAPRVCAISKQVAAALDAAHHLGMIHRDIKPENIVLLGEPGEEQVKVLDFGIAKIKEARVKETSGMTLTGAGVVVGTPQYMSPEQAMGKRGDELDGRSDLYSLGVVMYQMLSGDLPFKADTTMEMLIAHMQRTPKPLGDLHPAAAIPEPVSNLVMRLLEKDPAARPASARALIEELERVEKQPSPMNTTRVASVEQIYSPEAAARAVRESLGASIKRKKPSRAEPAVPPSQPIPPVAEPRPAARPAPRPVPPVAYQPVVAAQPKFSRWILWSALAVLVVAVGIGAWFITSERPSVGVQQQPQETTPVSSPGSEPAQSAAPGTSRATQPQENASGEASAGETADTPQAAAQSPESNTSRGASETKGSVSKPPPVIAASPPRAKSKAPASRPSVDIRAVRRAIAMGDVFYNRGDYDTALREYRRGLRADPSNATLKSKVEAALKAKAAESRILQQ